MLRKAALAELLKVSPWSVDRWRREDASFPQPIWITPNTPCWRVVEIEQWLATKQRGGLSPAVKGFAANKSNIKQFRAAAERERAGETPRRRLRRHAAQ